MPNHICSNCLQMKKPCTYLEASKPRGPPKAYITGLEDKMERLETLLKELRPEEDFSSELGPPIIRDSWKMSESLKLSREQSLPSSGSGLNSHLILGSQHGKNLSPSKSQWEIPTAASDDDSSSEESVNFDLLEIENISGLVQKLTLRGEDAMGRPSDNHVRFHGKSSAVGLVDAARKFKIMHFLDSGQPPSDSANDYRDSSSPGPSTRRPEFWHPPQWELEWEGLHIDSQELFALSLAEFPSPDLAKRLIDLYFLHANAQFPLLHRPTFERHWRDKLHQTNIWFCCVCLCLFAVAARWSDDSRVVKGTTTTASGEPEWALAGRSYFEASITIHRSRASLFHPATLFEMQTFTLTGIYLRGSANYPSAWLSISNGIRKCQDVGAHRRKVYHPEPTVDEELWKRAFWCLVVSDRIGSATLGRGCGVGDEDFDVDLPLEVDDEYWETEDPALAFKQPAGIPAKVCVFNQFIKLSQIMAFAMKTLYAIDKSKVLCGLTPSDWCKEVVEQLNMAMSEWATSLPQHLVWSPQMEHSPFAVAAATLRAFYHLVELLIYRPFIPSPSGSDISSLHGFRRYPAMDICVEAARSCARIVEVQTQQTILQHSIMTYSSQFCAGILLMKIWDLKRQERILHSQGVEDIKPPLVQQIEPLMTDVNTFIRALEWSEPRWKFVTSFLQELPQCLPVSMDVGAPGGQETMKNLIPHYTPVHSLPASYPPPATRLPSSPPPQLHSWQWQAPHNMNDATTLPQPHITSRPHPPPFRYDSAQPLKQELHSPSQHRRTESRYSDGSRYGAAAWPASHEPRTQHVRGRSISTSTLPIPVPTPGRSSSFASDGTRRTSYPAYLGSDPSRGSDEHLGYHSRPSASEGAIRYNDVDMNYGGTYNREAMYDYRRASDPRTTLPTFIQSSPSPSDLPGYAWDGQNQSVQVPERPTEHTPWGMNEQNYPSRIATQIHRSDARHYEEGLDHPYYYPSS
ncbi:Activator of stress genes 1 [Hypsizygus marmoreus]|uniref:Activator of stress genes 1 n=1 Tax=Hypsizygus marmoreus TaxID=39966 RepID=A0A369JXV0_HYPMA|nr:Activator of stress genes 1 [Hypsizygus marmoreus]